LLTCKNAGNRSRYGIFSCIFSRLYILEFTFSINPSIKSCYCKYTPAEFSPQINHE